ncbi:protein of unknown function DUF1524 RloF [Hyphomicrobium sulfonivorans]|uniref:RloF n=1 Tax=Hyphomicrobium sulfonivorans TaxID=121290 RepID=A0A125NU49_HYPSL|nr:DUF262 domain-containing protein [Hyphomicrobium sulfonivorans]KWT65530.1 protein of unknown function DUF1524 RloF [Hyphomicrobium sulfonivorans]
MHADVASILFIFESKRILEVPLFQRQYVWSEEKHWTPLWEDIKRKFTDYLEGRKDFPPHYLGALVLDQKQTPTTHVERRLIIDGQQRLTTFQIFLAALRDFALAAGEEEIAKECESFIFNTGMMNEPDVEKFKVLPTQKDRDQFKDVITARSRTAIDKLHPLKKKPRARKYDPRPQMIEAYAFFYASLCDYFNGTPDEPAIAAEAPLNDRLKECILALKAGLKLVVIDLDQDDDAQTIFETLNARGEPLLPADLLRNNIFLRAKQNQEDAEALHKLYWSAFDDDFWRVEVKQGRLSRPRSDLFLQHYLGSQVQREIPINHLFVEYRGWLKNKKPPFAKVADELDLLARQGKAFRRIMAPETADVFYRLGTFLNAFEIGTAHPLLLTLIEMGVGNQEIQEMSRSLESYMMRRAVCGLTNKNYNRVFLAAAKKLRDEGATPGVLEQFLSEQSGESTNWPNNRTFATALRGRDLYNGLQPRRCAFLLRRLNDHLYHNKMDVVTIESELTVEHLMPQNWVGHWLLPDGRSGLSQISLERMLDDPDSKDLIEASEKRDALAQTLGNLTLLTSPLNASISNSAWDVKHNALIQHSMLPISVELRTEETWDEAKIAARSERLAQKAIEIWPGPKSEAGKEAGAVTPEITF